jgi:hypothetical protein
MLQEDQDELPVTNQRRCLTIERWAFEEEREREAAAFLSPEDFHIWMIQKRAHLYQIGFEAFGTPLPVELSLPKIELPPQLAHFNKDKIFFMTKDNEFKVVTTLQD